MQTRASGLSVVLTNGCFDLLHVGHVRYLETAKSLGDVLIVGVNTDRSTRALKGPGRPIHGEQDRAEVVAALSSVDAVTLFDENTAIELVKRLRPDIYVKGGDYVSDPADLRYPPEGHEVVAQGGAVFIVDLIEGRSTTSTLERIEQQETGKND
jgi:rfaE bifunctional protein nucleotidyltransferase chain/domain